MTQFTFLQLLDETLSRYEQINESSSSINVSTDSCVEILILEKDNFFPKCDTLSIGTQWKLIRASYCHIVLDQPLFFIHTFWIFLETFIVFIGWEKQYKRWISKRVLHRNKACQIFWKTITSYPPPLICTYTCAYQGVRNIHFSGNFVCFVFLKHPFWDSPFCLINEKLVEPRKIKMDVSTSKIKEINLKNANAK